MGLQNLSRILDKYEQQFSSTNIQQFDRLIGLPFYDWSISSLHADRIISFNNAIGLPQKNGQSYPLFDYEQMLYDTLQSNKHVWIKKATGLGVTEFMLRLYGLVMFC